MELEAIVRQLMERSFEASVRGDIWSFADHALVETLVALVFSRPQRADCHFPDSLGQERRESGPLVLPLSSSVVSLPETFAGESVPAPVAKEAGE